MQRELCSKTILLDFGDREDSPKKKLTSLLERGSTI